jgi:hypothetical protein
MKNEPLMICKAEFIIRERRSRPELWFGTAFFIRAVGWGIAHYSLFIAHCFRLEAIFFFPLQKGLAFPDGFVYLSAFLRRQSSLHTLASYKDLEDKTNARNQSAHVLHGRLEADPSRLRGVSASEARRQISIAAM